MKKNLKDYLPSEIEKLAVEHSLPAYRGRQLNRWIFGKGVSDFSEMTDLSVSMREMLNSKFSLTTFPSCRRAESRDGSVKYYFLLEDGYEIEGVVMPSESKTTYCLSTQVGCPLGCLFCVTGSRGFTRNLTHAEMVDQFLLMRKDAVVRGTVSNIVLMGMGEPLLNFEAVDCFLRSITSDSGCGLSTRRITLSTVGLIKPLQKFSQKWPNIQLAVSLNAPNQKLREEIMPCTRRETLDELVAVLQTYPLPHRRRVTFEYVLLHGVNDSLEHAAELVELVRKIPSKINLIPYNEGQPGKYKSSREDTINAFAACLRDNNLTVMVRRSKGQDIGAACGQLGGGYGDKKE